MSDRDSGYLDQLFSVFGRRKKAEAVKPADPSKKDPQPAAPSPDRPAKSGTQFNRNRQAFETKLKALASKRESADSVVTGKVHLINLDKIRETMGDRWDKMSDHIHNVIKTELGNRLSSRDFFTRVDDDSYVIVFGDCPETEARLKVAILSEQILEKLLGADEAKDLDKLGVKSVVAQADGELAVEALDSMNALMQILDDAQAQQPDPDPDPEGETEEFPGKSALTPEEVAALLGNVDEHLRTYETAARPDEPMAMKIDRVRTLVNQLKVLEKTLISRWSEIPHSADPEDSALTSAEAENRDAALAQIEKLKAQADRQLSDLTSLESESQNSFPDTDEPPNVEYTYLPIWHSESEKVGIYLCEASISDSNGTPLYPAGGAQFLDEDFLAVVDRLVLYRAREDLRIAASQGRMNVVGVPVHFSTFKRPFNRNRFLELCWNIPEEHRNLLVWEIRGAHVDTWSMQLRDVVKQIERFSRAVFLRIDNTPESFRQIRNNLHYLAKMGVHTVGLDVSAVESSEAEKLSFLENLIEVANDSDLRCYGHGFDSLSLTMCAVCMGFQHVSGPAVAETVAQPRGIQKTAMENIYKRMLLSGSDTDAA